MKDFKGRTALVTGAGSGLGAAFAEIAASLGMQLVLADIDEQALHETARRFEQDTAVTVFRCDVSDADAVQGLAAHATRQFGAVHLLFNNAGVGAGGGFAWEASLSDWKWGLGVNTWGVIHGIHHVVPRMIAAAMDEPGYEGHIVNTSSMAGFFNPPLMAVYNASKQAVTAISETLHHDLEIAGVRIRCSVLAPFFVRTNIDQSERHRPESLRQEGSLTASQARVLEQSRAGMKSGRLSPLQVAQMTFDAVRNDRFYVFPHPRMLDSVERRMQAILQQADPVDPFAFRPEIYEALKSDLSYTGAHPGHAA